MQQKILNLIATIHVFFLSIAVAAADQSVLQVSQVRDVVKNIEIATQIGQGGQDQINSLQDLETVFGLTMSVLSVDMSSLSTQELQSIAFGGYTFISNPYDRSKGVSLNILKELLSLDFQEMAKSGTNAIYLGLLGVDASGNLLTSLSTNVLANSTTGGLDHFKLYIFKSDGTLLGTGPQYVPLNKYYSQTQQKFIMPVFGNNVASQTASGSSTTQNFEFLINGKDVTSSAQVSYPYLIYLENISGVDAPNRHLNFAELSSLLPNLATSTPIASFYQTLDSLEIIIGNRAFSFNQNSINQSTDIAADGICADISQYIAPLANTGMQLIFAAVDANGNIISDLEQVQNLVDHYLLYIFDQNNNLIKAVYVNPAYVTDASSFNIEQPVNGITVRINGQTVTQGQQYLYPVFINLTYGSGVKMPNIASIKNKITLKKGETLSSLVYNLNASSGAATLDLSQKSSFGSDWLDSINSLLAIGETILINVQQTLYSSGGAQASSGYEVIFTVYALDSATSANAQVAQQSFALPTQLSGLTIEYQTNLSKTSQTLSVSNLQNSWMVIIPSTTAIPSGQTLTYSSLQKISTYGTFKAILSMNKNTLYSVPVTSYVTTANTIPGLYNPGSKQYSGQGFGLLLNQMETTGRGYFFVEDMVNRTTTPFSGLSGVAALDVKSPLLQELESTIVSGSSCAMILLGFDAQGNYISDIIKTAPSQFGLFIFDEKGNSLSNSPVVFSANNYVGLGKYQLSPDAVGPATFIVNGLGIHQEKTLMYPFALKVTWKFKGAPKPKPKPKPAAVPTIPTIPTAMTISILQALSLSQLGCLLSDNSKQYFDAGFVTKVSAAFATAGNSVQIQISSLGVATAYANNNINSVIATSKAIPLSSGQTIKSLLYTVSGSSEAQVPITKISGRSSLWVQFKVVTTTYQDCLALSLSALQSLLHLNTVSITSTLPTFSALVPAWDLFLTQISSNFGYAFAQQAGSNQKTIVVPSSINSTIDCTQQGSGGSVQIKICSGSCSMVLLAFDANNNYMSNILDKTNLPVNFGLFMYDSNGNLLSGFPMQFNANTYYTGGYKLASTKGPAQFVLGGLTSDYKSLIYPFNLAITWKYQGS